MVLNPAFLILEDKKSHKTCVTKFMGAAAETVATFASSFREIFEMSNHKCKLTAFPLNVMR